MSSADTYFKNAASNALFNYTQGVSAQEVVDRLLSLYREIYPEDEF